MLIQSHGGGTHHLVCDDASRTVQMQAGEEIRLDGSLGMAGAASPGVRRRHVEER